ncbi:MAG: metallophosphoesterase [Endomicrobia bacterium]|nr:metallophosphoesterase [Endomicrobiia bacterium]
MKKHNFNRVIAIAAAFAFLFTSLIPQYAFSAQDDSKTSAILNAVQNAVPRSAGYITEHNIVSSSDNVLVYIQDLHCNPGVQKNISDIISSLDKNIGVDKVILEGLPEGKVESNVLTALPESVKYSVVEKLLGRGLLNGVELYSVESNKDNIYGVENWDKYIENIQRAADLLLVSDNAVRRIKPFEKDVFKKTKKTLDILGDLVSFKRDGRWYDKLSRAELEYSEPMYKYSNLAAYVNLRELSGQLNLNKVRKELDLYNLHLKNELSYRDYSNVVSKINNQIEYYEALYNAAENGDLVAFIEEYPNLYLFLTYSIKSSSINPILVFYDEETYVNKILNNETNDTSKFEDLLLYRMTSLLSSYLTLSMTDSEFEYFSGNMELYKSFISKKYPEYGNLIFTFLNNPEYGKYYAANRERNGIFLNNLAKEILEDGGKVNVFVSGGFHTSLVEDFKKKGISYVLITPVILEDFNSAEVYNMLIEINASVPRVLRNALNPIPIMLAVFPKIPEQSRQAYVGELVNTIVNSSRNYQSPSQLKTIIDEWINNIKGIKEGDISASYDNDVFKIKILEQTLEFKIKDGLIDFKESELFVPKTKKYEYVRIALGEIKDRFTVFGPTAADRAQYMAVRIINKAKGMKVSGDFYSRISKRSEDKWAFRIMKLFHRLRMKEAAKNMVDSIVRAHTKSSAENPARQAVLEIDGRKIDIVIERTIDLSDEDLLEIIENARNLPRGRASIEKIPDTLYIGLIDQSSHLFENYTGIGFIGINKALFEIGKPDSGLPLRSEEEKIAGDLRRITLKLGLSHEIAHEFLGNVKGSEVETFENIRLMQDIAYMINEVKKIYPMEIVASDADFGEHAYNEKIKNEYIMPYLNGILGGSRFLKRLSGYKLTLDELIDLMKEKNLSNEDIMHLEESYLTIQSDRSEERKKNDKEFFTGMVLKERKKDKIKDSELMKKEDNLTNFKIAFAKILELRTKLEDILHSTGEYSDAAIAKMTDSFYMNFTIGIDVMYETLPDHLFERYLNDKTMVREHGMSHSLDVMSYMLDILAKDKDRLKDLSNRNIRLMVYSALFHDLSTLVSRGNHEANSALMIEEMFKTLQDQDTSMTEESVNELMNICVGHKKIEDNLKLRDEHSNYLACLLHDADALSAVFELDRIFRIWAEMGDTVFFNKELEISQRIKLLKDNNFLDGDAVNDLIRQGFFRRKPNLYITEGAKTIIMSSLSDNLLRDYFESKRAELERIHDRKYSRSDVDLMISTVEEVIDALSSSIIRTKSSEVSAFTLKNRIRLLWQMIKSEIFNSKNVSYPRNVYLSDIHGGYDRLTAVLANILNVENVINKIKTMYQETDINAIRKAYEDYYIINEVKETLEQPDIDILEKALDETDINTVREILRKLEKNVIKRSLENSDINAIYVGGDLVDRGEAALEVIDLLANAAESGKVRFVEGNHDALVRMNLMGIHLPFYKNYKGVEADYEDMYGNVKDLLMSKIDEDERAKRSGSGIGTSRIRVNYATDKYKWAEKIAEYMENAKKNQKGKWDAIYEEMTVLFMETYGVTLDKKGKDILNNTNATGIFKDEKLRKWWGMILGRNVNTIVDTGLLAVDQMSINWWKIKKGELAELREEYGKSEAAKKAFDRMEEIIEEIIETQTAKMKEEVEVKGNWQWRVIDAIMARNYESVEWWVNDWGFHDGWGGGKKGLLAQRNIEIKTDVEREFRQRTGVSAEAELTKEQNEELQELLNKELLNNSNYMRDNRMADIGRFFQKNFFFYRRDEYGTYMMHSMLPVDNSGNVSIGRVVNGKIEKYEKNGQRIKGFYYKGRHYHRNSLFKGFEIIRRDIQNFNPETGDLGDMNEAFTLLYSIYSDFTTEVKHEDIRDRHQKIGFENILARMGRGVMRLTVGHNPISKTESVGLHPVEFAGSRMIFSIDDEFSKKYAAPMGRGGANIYSGDIGVAYVGFESGAEDAKIVGKTYVSKSQFLGSVFYDICRPLAAIVTLGYEFFDTGLYNIMDSIRNSLYKQRDYWDTDNTLLIDVINESGSYGRQHQRMKDLVNEEAHAVGIELKNMDLVAESERRLLKRDIEVQLEDGRSIVIPISFMHKKIKDRGKRVNYVDVYIGHEAKKIIKNNGSDFENIKDRILFAATSAFVEEIKKPKNPFEKYIHPVNSKRKILMRTQSLPVFDQVLTDAQRNFMKGVLVAHEGLSSINPFEKFVTEELKPLINMGYNLVLSDYYMIMPSTRITVEKAIEESVKIPKSTAELLSAA